MQQEDDLRGLAKVMEFMRAISIIFIVVHIYWFCYQAIVDMGINIGVVDKILLNFQNTAGLFSNLVLVTNAAKEAPFNIEELKPLKNLKLKDILR